MVENRNFMKRHIIATCFMSIFFLGIIFCWGLFIFQCVNKIFAIWSIVPIFILTGIAYPIVRGVFKPSVTTTKQNGKIKKVRKSPLELNERRGYTKGGVCGTLAMLLIVCGLGFVSYLQLYKKENSYASIVTATVIDYRVTTTVETETSGNKVESQETRVLELSLAYVFNGETVKATYNLNQTAKIFKPTTMKICLNEEGEIVTHYDNILFIKGCFWLCVAMAIYLFVILVLGVPYLECLCL